MLNLRVVSAVLLVVVVSLLSNSVHAQPESGLDKAEAGWDSSKWASVIRKVLDQFRGSLFVVQPSEWEKHQAEVAEWLNRQKVNGAIARGGCYKVYGTRAFSKFWFRENTKRMQGEPHFQAVSWMGVVEAQGQDAQEGVDQVFHFCCYQAAPDKAAPHPPRPGEVAAAPQAAFVPKGEGFEPAVLPADNSVPRMLVGADQRPPAGSTPRMTLETRYTSVKVGNKEGPYRYKEVFEGAAPSTRGYCVSDVTDFTDVANHKLCPSGAREDMAYKITVRFRPEVAKHWQFRLGPSFSMGGSTFVDEQAEDSRPENLWWKGNWQSEDVFVTPRRAFSAGKWHEVTFYGLSACCDGLMSLQVDTGNGWEDATVANIKKAQVEGWTPAAKMEGLALGRGAGTHSYSVVESGTANFGSHQTAWTLHQVDGAASFVRRINFGVFFHWAPVVQVYLRRLDSSRDTNVRVFARAKNVDSTGFDLEIIKYGDTRVYQAGISYFAFDADPMYGTKFGHACTKGSYLDNQSLPKAPEASELRDLLLADLLMQEPAVTATAVAPAPATTAKVSAFAAVPLQKWTLHEFSGFRKFEVAVPFRDPLPDKPTHAFTGINMIDAASGANLVTSVKLFNLGDRGVDFEFNTAGNSRILAEGACMLSWTPVRRQIETGEVPLSSIKNPALWKLNEGRGLRELFVRVDFAKTFAEPPNVLVALTHINAAGNHNLRFDITVHSKDSRGFQVRVATWGQSSLTALTVSWLATADGMTNGLAPDTPGEKSDIYYDPRARSRKGNNPEEWTDNNEKAQNHQDNDDDRRMKL